MNLIERVNQLKKEKNTIILAHYYVPEDIQKIADYVGDSYYLSKIASQVIEDTIVFCGVKFMGESAKTLNPNKTVLMPDSRADCPMAHMVDLDKIKQLREEVKDLAVVCYINSTSELKAHSDVCVTSSNVVTIIKALDAKNIYFVPDQNLGRYIASKVPDKNFIFNEGHCPIHTNITETDLLNQKKVYPNALVLAHPECTQEVLKHADYIGSTSGIIDFAQKSVHQEFIIATETGVFYELNRKCPQKNFYAVNHKQICPNMKLNTLQKVIDVLENENNSITLNEELRLQAKTALQRMLELA